MESLDSKLERRVVLRGGLAGLVLLATNGCGYLLYPERRGRSGGRIDTPVLVIDLLWLLPGLVPGIICLIVDFTTGCIYESGGRASRTPERGNSLAATATVALDGVVVANGVVRPDRSAELNWEQSFDAETLRQNGRLVVRSADGAIAEAQLRDLF